jgi:hypothetical protein
VNETLSRVLEKQAGSYLNHDGMQGIEFPAEIYD